ncbi:hypothetical protein AtNW77_Chr4g0303581 [Arabidopsis thaliana]
MVLANTKVGMFSSFAILNLSLVFSPSLPLNYDSPLSRTALSLSLRMIIDESHAIERSSVMILI